MSWRCIDFKDMYQWHYTCTQVIHKRIGIDRLHVNDCINKSYKQRWPYRYISCLNIKNIDIIYIVHRAEFFPAAQSDSSPEP